MISLIIADLAKSADRIATMRSHLVPVTSLRFDAGMSPCMIPLSGGDRKVQPKGIRYAHGIHASHYRESVLISAVPPRLRSVKPIGWSPGTRLCPLAARRCPRPANRRPSQRSGELSMADFNLFKRYVRSPTRSSWRGRPWICCRKHDRVITFERK